MQITENFASLVVGNLRSFLDYNINIMNDHGIIVGTGDKERLYQQHEAALRVIETGKPVVVEHEDVENYRGTRSGVNLPIEFNSFVIGVVGISGAPSEIYPFARLTKMTVELLLQQIYMSRQNEMRKAAIRTWVLSLIDPNGFDLERSIVVASTLKIDLTIKRSVLLLHISNHFLGLYTVDDHDRLQEIVEHLHHEFPPNTIYTFWGDTCFLALPISHDAQQETHKIMEHARQLADDLGLICSCAIGRTYTGAMGYRKSYVQAARVIDVQQKLQKSDWLSIDDLGIVSLLAQVSPPAFEEFVEPYMEGLQQLSTEDLMTLQVYLDCKGNSREVISKLHIHRNTLLYRLNKVHLMLGLDAQDFHDAMALYALLLSFQIHATLS